MSKKTNPANSDVLRVESKRQGVVVITYDNPPVNAVSAEDNLQIAATFRRVGDARDTRVIIFTAEGTRAFMAGADLKKKGDESDRLSAMGPRYQLDPGLAGREGLHAVAGCAVPVIGAINGPLVGAGVGYAACCDVLLATEDTFLQMGEINVGLLGGVSQLTRLVGPFEARRLYYTAARMSAHDLYLHGCVYKVLRTREEVLEAALNLALEISAKSPTAIRLAKQVFSRLQTDGMLEAYRMEQDYTERLRGLADSTEAREAFLEKRTPVWRGF